MKVAYVTPYYNGQCDGRSGRFHDWIHMLRDMDNPPFDIEIHTTMVTNKDETLAWTPWSVLGDAAELWGTKRNKVEKLLNVPRLYQGLTRSKADIVHFVAYDTILVFPVKAAVSDIPLVFGPNIGGWYPIRDEHEWLANSFNEMKLKAKYYLRKFLVHRLEYQHIIAFSEYHRSMLNSIDISGEDMTILRPGVHQIFSPEKDPEPPDPTPELLYVGDFSSHKGYPLFLKSLAQLDQPVIARLIGSGDPNRPLIRSLGLKDQVIIEGFVTRKELPKYYHSADLFVLPTIDETAGTNAQFEALACGTPVVVTRAPGMNDFTPEDAAITFWPRDSNHLAQAIETALEKLDQLTIGARNHASEFSALKTVDQLNVVYEKLL